MAKGKRAVALFEVINKDKRFERKAAAPPPPKPVVNFSPERAAEAAEMWRRKNADPETIPAAPLPKIKRDPVLIPRLKVIWEKSVCQAAALVERTKSTAVEYQSVLTGTAAALVMIGAVLVVRHLVHPPAQAGSIAQILQNGPAHPSVLNVPADKSSDNTLSPEMAADVMQASDTGGPVTAPVPAEPAAAPGQRIVNLNYVLVQSYFDEKTAIEARDFLNQNGVPCTIERGVKGWRQDFYQVIGLQGFSHLAGSDYINYRKRLDELSVQFSPKGKYKRFQPQAIKW